MLRPTDARLSKVTIVVQFVQPRVAVYFGVYDLIVIMVMTGTNPFRTCRLRIPLFHYWKKLRAGSGSEK
jgi:hypothetical protein